MDKDNAAIFDQAATLGGALAKAIAGTGCYVSLDVEVANERVSVSVDDRRAEEQAADFAQIERRQQQQLDWLHGRSSASVTMTAETEVPTEHSMGFETTNEGENDDDDRASEARMEKLKREGDDIEALARKLYENEPARRMFGSDGMNAGSYDEADRRVKCYWLQLAAVAIGGRPVITDEHDAFFPGTLEVARDDGDDDLPRHMRGFRPGDRVTKRKSLFLIDGSVSSDRAGTVTEVNAEGIEVTWDSIVQKIRASAIPNVLAD